MPPPWAALVCRFLLFVMIIVLYSIFVLFFFFCMGLANRIELGFQIERAEVGVGGGQPVSEEAKPASQAPKTSAPA